MMKWTGFGAIACAAMLAVGCAPDRQDRLDEDRSARGTGDESLFGDEQTRYGQEDGAVGTSGMQAAQTDPREFVRHAAMTNEAEIALAQLALDRSQNREVREFAQMMMRDHKKANDELNRAVQGQNVDVTQVQMDQKHQQLLERLKTLRGAEFDREYMKAMVEGHMEARDLIEHWSDQGRQARTGQTPADQPRRQTGTTGRPTGTTGAAGDAELEKAANQWANKTLPTIEQHLQKAEQIQAKVDPGARTGTTGTTTGTQQHQDQHRR